MVGLVESSAIKVKEFLVYLKNKRELIEKELNELRLTKEDVAGRMKSVTIVQSKEKRNSFVRDIMELEYKIYYLEGRLQELQDLKEEILRAVSSALME